tara:strand:- start:189 stop:1004 length:816 start_codon:yes stop_codon:yes gene_type:complete
MKNIDLLNKVSQKLRISILSMTHGAGKNGAHAGGALSIVEILAFLYFGGIFRYDVDRPYKVERDRFILSKGHASLALFGILEQVGFLSSEDTDLFEVNGSPFYSHAKRDLSRGIEFSGGSLSLGLSYAVGVAISCRMDKLDNHVYVLVGDGECDEGLVWESLMSASNFNLTNLTVIVDFNGMQSDGHSIDIMDKTNLGDKFHSFGFHVKEIDGHNLDEIEQAFASRDFLKPNAIIAHTIKGKGVSFMENNIDWHHGVLSKELYESALSEQK